MTNALLNAVGDHVVAVVLESRATSMRGAIRRYSLPRVAERLATKAIRRVLRFGPRTADALQFGARRSASMNGASRARDAESERRADTAGRARVEPDPCLRLWHRDRREGHAQRRASLPQHAHRDLADRTGAPMLNSGRCTDQAPRSRWKRPSMTVCRRSTVGLSMRPPAPHYGRAMTCSRRSRAACRSARRCYADIARRLAAGEELTPSPKIYSLGRAYRFIDRTCP